MKEEPTKQPDTECSMNMILAMEFGANMQIDTMPRITIRLDPDVAEIFPDAKSVNDALRALANIIASPKNLKSCFRQKNSNQQQ